MDQTYSRNALPEICGLCEKKPRKYCCPRCEVFYCSLECYKCEKHVDCSENFYRDCISEELAVTLMDKESQLQMIEMLKRENNKVVCDNEDISRLEDEEIDSDDENVTDLHDRVKNLDLDDADAVWEALTQDERNEFECMLENKSVYTLIPSWDPWWLYKEEDKLILDLSAIDDEKSMQLSKCPALVNVPKYSTIAVCKPNPKVRYNITNCIGAYALVMRYFNGELNSKLYLKAATWMYYMCDTLNDKRNYQTEEAALDSIADICHKINMLDSTANNYHQMIEDVSHISKGPSKENPSLYCKCALSHMHTIFNEARKLLKNSKTEPIENDSEFSFEFLDILTREGNKFEIDSAMLKLSIKKIEYYLSYLNSIYSHYNKQPEDETYLITG